MFPTPHGLRALPFCRWLSCPLLIIYHSSRNTHVRPNGVERLSVSTAVVFDRRALHCDDVEHASVGVVLCPLPSMSLLSICFRLRRYVLVRTDWTKILLRHDIYANDMFRMHLFLL